MNSMIISSVVEKTSPSEGDTTPSVSAHDRSGRSFAMALSALIVLGIVAFAVTRISSIREDMSKEATAGLMIGTYLLATVLVIVRVVSRSANRVAWAMIAAGLAWFTAGSTYANLATSDGELLSFPSFADLAWLLMMPFMFIGIGLLIAAQVRRTPARVVLDGAIVGLGVATVVAALAMDRWIFSFPTMRTVETVTKFAYPATDALLVGMVASLLVLSRPAARRNVLLLAVGSLLFAFGDIRYLTLLTQGKYLPGDLVDVAYVAALGFIGLSAWWPGREVEPTEAVNVAVVLPVVSAAAAVGVLFVGTSTTISPVPVILAIAAVVAFAIRALLSPKLHPAMPAQGAGTAA